MIPRSLKLFVQLLLISAAMVGAVLAAPEKKGAQPTPTAAKAEANSVDLGGASVVIIDLKMMILPGTSAFLSKAIQEATLLGAKVLIVRLDTPGGMLNTSQDMIQEIFKSPVPVVIYVAPSGATATSAGVFITMAGHIAAMAPGTSIGAAHPVAGDGKDIEGDMRTKAENMAVAMVKSISEQRGRNVAWAEKSVKESSSLTEGEALKENVVDLVAQDIDDLLRQLKGREVKVGSLSVVLDDYSQLPRHTLEMGFQDQVLNVMANPNIAALLWLGATTGITLELYNPGAIIPGVVGVICLILALAVSQIVPVSYSGVMLMLLGAVLIGAEMYVGHGVLAVGGVIAMILGAIYLIDVSQAPGMAVAMEFIMPAALVAALLMGWVVTVVRRAYRQKPTTGADDMAGAIGTAVEAVCPQGRVSVRGEFWNAVCDPQAPGLIEAGSEIEVVRMEAGLTLVVRRVL